MLRSRLFALLICVPTLAWTEVTETPASHPVDRVVVIKSDRELRLIRSGRTIETYRISLGRDPSGDKIAAGDNRTPEGRYTLDWRNPESEYYKSIHISYPNERDRREARDWGLNPGGNIMIHGLPNDAGEWSFAFRGLDWTQGCIAVTNEAMDEIWARVPSGTPIEIRP